MAADAGSRDPDSDGDAMLQLIKFGLHSIYHILVQSLHIFVVSANTNTNNPFSYFLYLYNCYKAAADCGEYRAAAGCWELPRPGLKYCHSQCVKTIQIEFFPIIVLGHNVKIFVTKF